MYGIQTYNRYTWTISQNSLRCQLCPRRSIVAGPAGRQFESGIAGRWLPTFDVVEDVEPYLIEHRRFILSWLRFW